MVRAEKLAHARPYIVVGAFVIGMLLTPPDIISQTLLAVPMWLLFELGLLIGGYIVKKRGLDKDEDDVDYDEDPYDMPESQAGQQRAQATSSTNSQQTSTTQTQTSQAIQELDQRYADQVDDDLDWDDEFDKIDDQMRKLEREYQARKDQEKAEKDAAEQGKKEDNLNGDTSETAEKSSVDIANDKQGKPDSQKS
ncbi:sec-independent protein translocase protein TatC [uncultured Thiomicrorhabdus sp.]